jgi:hypothetical protein
MFYLQVRDAGHLLACAKFTLQTVDTEEVSLAYDNIADPFIHLRVRSFSCPFQCSGLSKLELACQLSCAVVGAFDSRPPIVLLSMSMTA